MPDNPVFAVEEGDNVLKNLDRQNAAVVPPPQLPPGSFKDMDIELQNLSLNRKQSVRPTVVLSANSVRTKEGDTLHKDPWTAPEFTENGPSWSGTAC